MSAHFNINGTYKTMSDCKVNIGGIWKTVTDILVKIGTTWKYVLKAPSLSKYPSTLTMSVARGIAAGASVGTYAVFCAGSTNVTDAFNTSLVRTTPTATSVSYDAVTGVSISNYAVFGGGKNTPAVNAYNASLTRSNPLIDTSFKVNGNEISGTDVNGNALFANFYNSGFKNTVVVYDSVLNKTTLSMTSARYSAGVGSNGSFALMAGGYTSSGMTDLVDMFNASLTRTNTTMPEKRLTPAVVGIGNYVLVCGGLSVSNTGIYTALPYNSSLVRSTSIYNSGYVRGVGVISNFKNLYGMLAGGTVPDESSSATVVEYYTPALVRGTTTSLSTGRYYTAGANIGDYALFAGGKNGTTPSNIVDVYQYN